MKRLLCLSLSLVPLFCSLAITGCGFTPGFGSVNQITLAIYHPLCVDVVDASTASGAPVQVYACGTGKRSQEWRLNPIDSNGGLNIVNVNSNMCMSVSDTPVTAPGQYVIQETCSASGTQPNQVWTMVKAPSQPGYRFVSAASKQCLDLPYGAVASIDHLQQYYCTDGDPAQGWSITQVGLGNIP
ncbi:RICIN domain-containing protein [Acidipila rosea]|uniref:Ricin-type beta-trefoil lectin protein n=1 Tax=Acidipila rosea TaxID=768535 RepID=A0A4R1L239_9BACT|nr:RICIN domain-containing protein [Acidipila rosea]MBW4028589.1 ricin-type beta-trefoil lectin domain protein [Acidobacteriota bacterium]MBW4045218.1 ricin-type beta-trefoil lectin domain protein [Acidobacteriota bacterium]TCK72058.1 ricin-type beta-trefoil lectin protein [Acidipila rosea]